MRAVLTVAVLVAVCLLLSESALLEGSTEHELNFYIVQAKYVHKLLASECPSYIEEKRQLADHQARVGFYKTLFEELFQKLLKCRNTNKKSLEATSGQVTSTTTKRAILTTTEQKIQTTTKQTTPTTSKQTTPTTTTQLDECQQAVNYTQSWRRDHKGSGIRPGGPVSRLGYACDLHSYSSHWFRFSGGAGTHLLDSCPKSFSCGTIYPMWTDERMPTQIGVEATLYAYAATYNCKHFSYSIKVIRCSWNTPHDLIYKQTENYTVNCNEAFCGMM